MSTSVLKQRAFVSAFLVAITFIFMASSYTTRQPGKVKVEDGWIQGTVEDDLAVL